MFRQLLPVSSLLLGSAILLFAGGMNGLILAVRGTAEGFSAFSLGLLGAGYAIGYVAGCLATPYLVARVGHIRSFSVMCALAAIALLLSLLYITPYAWVPLRAISGFCFAGAAMIVESWLSDRAVPTTRGRIFGIYTMVNLFASTGGQLSLTLGDPSTLTFFVMGAIFYCLALVPTAISSTASPQPLVAVRLDLRGLWRNSPVAVFAVFCIGLSNSAFGTLSPVYADRVGLALSSVALFASLPFLAGAVSQIPIGALSDRFDRRVVLIGVAAIALAVDLAFVVIAPEGRGANLALAAAFGAAVLAVYPIAVAHANDHAAEGSGIQVSGGLLMLFGVASIFGPVIAGATMAQVGATGLFYLSAGAHLALIAFTAYRMTKRDAVPDVDKGSFVASAPMRAATPEAAALAVSEPEAQPDRPDLRPGAV